MHKTITQKQITPLKLNEFQSKLFPYAYNILGDAMAAEDLVQEILNNFFITSSDHISRPDNYLIRSVINRAINQKKLLRTRLETYPGRWLPSPVLTEDYIYAETDRQNILDYTLLILLENLNAKERAVFILKESFDFTHLEIANTLHIQEEDSRQVLKRARNKLMVRPPKTSPSSDESKVILEKLSQAMRATDLDMVKTLLSQDVVAVSDGGPHVSAARNPILGPDHVLKLLQAIYGKYLYEGTSIKVSTINHQPAILFIVQEEVYRCAIFQMDNHNLIKDIFIIVNPDKLSQIQLF